jgi:chromosomal replication initiator protein
VSEVDQPSRLARLAGARGQPPTEAIARRDLGSLWRTVAEQLRASVPDSTFRLWLEPLRATAVQGRTLYISAPDGIRAWVERRYAPLIVEALAQVAPDLGEVSFSAPAGASAKQAERLGLNPSYTFDRFVIGEGNRLAHAAALAVAEAPSEAYNPLFLHGPPGVGKTHLLGAIGNYLRDNAPALSVLYTTAERFTNEFVAALRSSGAEEFKRRHRDIDVLLIDDIQFLEGKQHTEEEFFHTFNALYEAGSQLVLSADRMPSELKTLAERLRDRFEWGLMVPVEPTNLATRLAVLRRLVREAGIEIADREALVELARRIPANMRQLHGALTRAIAHASLMARPLTAELIAEVLPSEVAALERPTVERIQAATCDALGVSPAELVGSRRTRDVLRARKVAIYLTRELTDLSLPEIGRSFGGRDHSTVLNAIQRVGGQLESDPNLSRDVERVRVRLHNPGRAQSLGSRAR